MLLALGSGWSMLEQILKDATDPHRGAGSLRCLVLLSDNKTRPTLSISGGAQRRPPRAVVGGWHTSTGASSTAWPHGTAPRLHMACATNQPDGGNATQPPAMSQDDATIIERTVAD